MSDLYIGLMSGTSLDGVDGVLADFSGAHPRVLAHHSQPFPESLRTEFLDLNRSGPNELHRAALAANALTRCYATVVQGLLHTHPVPAQAVQAIGAHGQTVRHRPGEFDGTGYTLQINQPALLAESTGIAVVADFRSRDIAAGGQGAPLVPAFHQAIFGHLDTPLAVLNIGGISNLTLLQPRADIAVQGFDCGPGNALLDAWCQTHTGAHYDDQGRWAASGQVIPHLLKLLLEEPFLHKSAPKSTGRDLFNNDWLRTNLERHKARHQACLVQDVQNTLTEFTAVTCAQALLRAMPQCEQLVVCGGGAYNTFLMRRLQSYLPLCRVHSSETLGMPPQQMEACAFAWLARQTVLGHTASVPTVTGARGARILGCIYPA